MPYGRVQSDRFRIRLLMGVLLQRVAVDEFFLLPQIRQRKGTKKKVFEQQRNIAQENATSFNQTQSQNITNGEILSTASIFQQPFKFSTVKLVPFIRLSSVCFLWKNGKQTLNLFILLSSDSDEKILRLYICSKWVGWCMRILSGQKVVIMSVVVWWRSC